MFAWLQIGTHFDDELVDWEDPSDGHAIVEPISTYSWCW